MRTITTRVRHLVPDRSAALLVAFVLYVEAMVVVGYLVAANVTITDPLILVYPFVWINVGGWAVLSTTPAPADQRTRILGAAVAVGYFVVLAAAGGLVSPGHALHGHSHGSGFRIALASMPPGWGPALLYGGSLVQVSLIPFKAIGYLALSYLIYATVLDAAGSALAGVLGVFSCVSCTWPILGTIVTGVFGGASAVTAVATNQPYGASTLVFLSAIALLAWRPLQ